MRDEKIAQAFDIWSKKVINIFSNPDFTPILPQIREIVYRSIMKNFREGGRYGNDNIYGGGSQKWEPSKRAKGDKGYKGRGSGKTLIDRATLMKSIYVFVGQNRNKIIISAGSNLPYAAIHNFGGTITRMPSRSKSRSKTRSGAYSSFEIEIKARPYIVLQNEDIKKIFDIVIRHYKSILRGR